MNYADGKKAVHVNVPVRLYMAMKERARVEQRSLAATVSRAFAAYLGWDPNQVEP